MPTSYNFRLERPLHFRIGDALTLGQLFVGDIQWLDDRKAWACHWSISHVHPEIGRLYGGDPLQALTATLDFVASLIRGSERDGLVVWWQQEGDHAGMTFPLCEDRTWDQMPPQR
jgi:hypothetical protein